MVFAQHTNHNGLFDPSLKKVEIFKIRPGSGAGRRRAWAEGGGGGGGVHQATAIATEQNIVV